MPVDLLAQQDSQTQQPIDLLAGVPQQPGVLQTMRQRGMSPGAGLFGGQFGGGGGLLQQLRAAQGIKPFLKETFEPPVATGAGAIGEARRLAPDLFPAGGALPGQQAALQRQQQVLAGLRARRPEQSLAGKRLADIGTFLAGEKGVGGILGKLGGKGFLPTVGRKLATGFPAGAAASPDNRIKGGIAGSLAEAAPEIIPRTLKAIPKMDVVLRSRLGQRVISGFEKVKTKATELYNTAFEGTEGIKPKLTDETQANINELKERFPGARGDIPRAIKAYEDDKSLHNLHFLRSNLGDVWQKLEVKSKTPGSVFTKEDSADQEAISDTRKNISKSLENNFNKLNPEKKSQYDKAQKHFENKVAPFREKGHTAIMKALSPDRDITNKLFTEIGADSVKAQKVRDVLGLSRPQLDIARLLRNKLLTLPAAGAALGTGAFFGAKKFL